MHLDAFGWTSWPSILRRKSPPCLAGPINQLPGPREAGPSRVEFSALVHPALYAGPQVPRCVRGRRSRVVRGVVDLALWARQRDD